MILKTFLKPLFFKVCDFYLKVAIVDVSYKYFTGFAKISFDDQSYSTKIAVSPSLDMIRKFYV